MTRLPEPPGRPDLLPLGRDARVVVTSSPRLAEVISHKDASPIPSGPDRPGRAPWPGGAPLPDPGCRRCRGGGGPGQGGGSTGSIPKAPDRFRGGVTRRPINAPNTLLPRARTLWRNSKKPRYTGSFSCEIPRCGRSQLRNSDQNPSVSVHVWPPRSTSSPAPSSSRWRRPSGRSPCPRALGSWPTSAWRSAWRPLPAGRPIICAFAVPTRDGPHEPPREMRSPGRLRLRLRLSASRTSFARAHPGRAGRIRSRYGTRPGRG